jgi:hypothetical protein
MVIRLLSHRQIQSSRSISAVLTAIACFALGLHGCRSWPSGSYRGSITGRIFEFQSGIAYITEGHSTQAISYDVDGEKVILNLPFTNEVLRRLPDGALSGMGETLLHVEESTAAVRGIYAGEEGNYRRCLPSDGSIKLICTDQDEMASAFEGFIRMADSSRSMSCEES